MKLYDYLCRERGIDGDIVHKLIQEERIYEDRCANVVFIGFDEHDKPRFATLRGTHGDYRMDCIGSDKRYGFFMSATEPSERLYIFESAIDAMSHASLANALEDDSRAWERESRLSLAGTSDIALDFFLNQHKEVKELVFCLDNDSVGRKATEAMTRKYAERGYLTRTELPRSKDFNVDLQDLVKQIQQAIRTRKVERDVSF